MERDSTILTEHIIANRRTIKPHMYSGNEVPDEHVQRMLEAANWAPTHGHTQPWQFTVYTAGGKEQLLEFLHAMDKEDRGHNEVRYAKLRDSIERSSHVIGIGMKRGDNLKIPEIEEMLAVAAAVQNMWLVASSLGIGAYWSTGDRGHDPRLARFMELDSATDKAMGLFFIGAFNKEWPEGRRLAGIESRVKWIRT